MKIKVIDINIKDIFKKICNILVTLLMVIITLIVIAGIMFFNYFLLSSLIYFYENSLLPGNIIVFMITSIGILINTVLMTYNVMKLFCKNML